MTIAYDAWGKVLEKKMCVSCIASRHNPFIYKGYFLDEETGFYYLKSRYYDPTIRRFISIDSPEYISQEDLSGLNLYVYCGNNPVMRYDPSGCFWDVVLDIGFLIWSIYDIIQDPKDWKNWAALGLDIVFAAVPFLTGGGGRIIKAGNMIDDAGDIVKAINRIDDVNDLRKVTIVGRNMDRVKDTAKLIGVTDNIYDTWKGYDRVKDVSKTLANTFSIAHNGGWLFGKLRKGYTVIDLGLTVTRKGRGLWYGTETIIMLMWKTRNIWKFLLNYYL